MEAEQIDTRTPWQRTELSNSYRRMAEALLWAGQYGRALASAKHAVDLDPKDWESHFTLGKVYAAYEKGPLARNEYRLAQFLGGDKDVALLIAWTGSLKKERLFKVEKSVRKEFRIHPLACLPKDF